MMSHRHTPVRLAVAAILGTTALAGLTPCAMAQQAQPATKAAEEEVLQEVQITGSRIVRKDLESNSPILTLSSEILENRPEFAIESALNELPQFVPSLTGFSDVNRQQQLGAASNQFNTNQISFSAGNTVGATNVSLRGLGANRNLVLMNGKRLVPVNASMGVDTSSIPSSALQRVEIVTGGASSVYGADAVSGVVNFILKENFQGADFDTQYGVSQRGDDRNLRISALLGGNFANERGNAMLGLEFADRGTALQIDRDYYRRRLLDPYAGAGANASLTGYAAGTSPVPFGTVPFGGSWVPDQAVVNQIFGLAPGTTPENGVPATSTFLLNPDGTVFVTDRDGAGRFNGPLDGLQYKINQQNGQWAENNLLSRISSPLRRYSMFGSAHYDVNKNLTLYAQTTFAQSKTSSVFDPGMAFSYWGVLIPHGSGRNCTTVGVTSGGCQNTDPLPANLAAFGSWANVPTAAKYLAGGAAGLNCPATGGCTNSQAFPVPTELGMLLDSRLNQLAIPGANGAPTTYVRIPDLNARNADFAVDLPMMTMFGSPRGTRNESTNWQLIAGGRGEIGVRDWTYDLYTSFGTSRTTQQATGAESYNILRALARQPNYGRGALLEGNITPPGSTTQNHPTARCTSGLPVFPSLFGGQISQDCIDMVVVDPVTTTRMDQTVAEGSVQGGLFELPAGDLRFAAGVGYRKNKFEFIPADILSQESVLDGVVGFSPISGNENSDQVKEGFTELLVPVLKDLPFVKHLNVELGYRYSDYRYGGKVTTYKALGDWAITPDIRLRGGYQKANRAPNLVELFQKDSDQFLAGPGDPCANNSGLSWSVNANANGNNAENAAKVRQICEALMGPGANTFYTTSSNHTGFFNALGFSFETARVSGNPNLKSESSDTYTIGAVMRSPFKSPLAQFSMSVDYFKIDVTDAIGTVQLNSLYGGIYRHCYDPEYNPTLDANNSFCLQVPRDQNTGAKLANPKITYSNVGGIISQGVDLSFNWSAALSDLGVGFLPGRVSYGLNGNYMIKDARQAAPGEPFEEFTGLSGFGSFRWTVFNTFGWFNGPVNASLNWRHYPSTESYSHFAGIDERVQGIEAYDIFDLSFGYAFKEGLFLRGGVSNLFDKAPPTSDYNPGDGGPGTDGYNPGSIASGGAYDLLGRRFFLGFKLSF
jgi:outer membrane receptor protein involved in Fe transport